MTANGWLQIGVFLLAILAVTPLIGRFMTRVFNRERTFLDPILRPIERLVYRLTGVDETHEMRWTEYAAAMMLFSVVSMLMLYLIQRLQQWLPWNPQRFGPVAPALAFNTAASFTTNTNWQAYSGERDRAGGRLHPRHRAAREGDARQLLGRSGALQPVAAAALLPGRRTPPR